jgi:hypothetical protein
MGLHQIKKLLHSKAVTRLKRQPTGWEEILASDLFDKGLISRIYREFKKLSPQRIDTPVKKWTHELNREFSKEEVQMASKYVKKYSTSQVIKEMKMKTTLRFHLTPVRMPKSRVITTNAGQDVVKQEPLHTVDGNAN